MMPDSAPVASQDEFFVLSNLSPGPVQKRLALTVVIGLLVVFALITTGELSSLETGRIGAFVPIYLTMMFVNDSITAILLYARFSILRSRAILVIASGYVFSALMLIPYILTFPGVFAPEGLIGGVQSPPWLYFFQYGGFPLFVIGYALSKDRDPGERRSQGAIGAEIALSVVLTAALVSIVAFIFIEGEVLLPRVLLDNRRLGPLWPYVGVPVALLSLAGIVVLWSRRRSMLDLWLLVVLCAYAMFIPLSYFSTPVRFSVGWYTVRIFATLSSSLVLVFLLYETTTLYTRLVRAVLAQRREREARLVTGDAVAATIAHEVKQPLTAMITRADTGFRWLDRPVPDLGIAKDAFRQISADGHRAAAVIDGIRANFRKDARIRTSVDLNELIGEALALVRDDLRHHRILVRAEPNARLPQVAGDRIQLQQVLLNLITNAIDSMAVRDGPRVLHVGSEIRDTGEVVVSVADSGAGISSQDAARIFDPLFTTKSGGMGMGLSICRSIVEAHEGRLSVVPNEPEGAVFHFTLRLAQ